MKSRIGWVVDAQVDFMDPAGRLYVRDLGDDADPGSRLIVDRLTRAVEWMRDQCDVTVFTGDWHGAEDEEIDPVAPNPEVGTYPPHCMGRSTDPDERAGAEIIPEIRPRDPILLEHDAEPEQGAAVARRALESGRPIFVHKTRFDVFAGNAATDDLVEELVHALGGDPEVVVVGVARDVCVTQAVDGMIARGVRVTPLSDVTWGLGLEPEDVTLGRWAKGGGVRTLDQLLAERVAGGEASETRRGS